LVILAVVAGSFALNYARSILIPFVLAVFLTYIIHPVADLLQQRMRTPRWAALVTTFLLALILIGVTGLVVTSNIRGLLADLETYRERIVGIANWSVQLAQRFGVELNRELITEGLKKLNLFNEVAQFAGQFVNFISTTILVLIFLMFLLSGQKTQTKSNGIYAEIDHKIRKYLLTKFTTSGVTGVLTWIILALLGVELAFMFGLLAFLLNFIPTFGSLIATFAPLPVVFMQTNSVATIVSAIALPGAVQFTVGNIIEPKLMGESLDLHPAVILLALMFWGLLWGVVGMILAVPIMAVIKIVLNRISRPWAEVLAGRLPDSG